VLSGDQPGKRGNERKRKRKERERERRLDDQRISLALEGLERKYSRPN
jgi:hypothetical protein